MPAPTSLTEVTLKFESGDIWRCSEDDLEKLIALVAALNTGDPNERNKAVVQTLVINHLQMKKALKEMNDKNAKTQRLVLTLTWVAVGIGLIQTIAALIAIGMAS